MRVNTPALRLAALCVGASTIAGVLASFPVSSASAADVSPPLQKTASVGVSDISPTSDAFTADDTTSHVIDPDGTAKAAVAKAGARGSVALARAWGDSATGLAMRLTASAATGSAGSSTIAVLKTRNTKLTTTHDYAYRVTVPKKAGAKPVQVGFDYTRYAAAHGGDWVQRLRLRLLTGCPQSGTSVSACKGSVALPTKLDTASGRVIATLPASAAGRAVVLATNTSASSEAGDFSASKINASSSWSAGSQSGDFDWTYPIDTPSATGGPEPDLSVSYSSGSLDGETDASDNQSSWVGDGFSLDPGYIERTYEPCRDVGGTRVTKSSGDLCWNNDDLHVSLGSSGGQLLRVAGSQTQWRMKADDGSTIELRNPSAVSGKGYVAGAGYGKNEYWVLTKTDGTRYYFGLDKRFASDSEPTNSVSTVPVYAGSSSDPCYKASFADSACDQVWRWSLDYVVDPHGNTMTYRYAQESNKYAAGLSTTASKSYDRGSYLTSIEYGQTAGSENSSSAPARVLFTVADRKTKTGWPDAPTDELCSKDDCGENTSPTFFTSKRLTNITTQVLEGKSYQSVNSWDLDQQFLNTGDPASVSSADASTKVMWLRSITQTGKADADGKSDIALPSVRFSGELLDNRVGSLGTGQTFSRYRVNQITNGTGGMITVSYTSPDKGKDAKGADKKCMPKQVDSIAVDANTYSCFPTYYQESADGENAPWRKEFFYKYLVSTVVEQDKTTGSPAVVTSYTYNGGGAWHYADVATIPKDHRTWSDWRGYSSVTTQVGSGSDPRTSSTTYYLRGMDGDPNLKGAADKVTVPLETGQASGDKVFADEDALAGFVRRTVTLQDASTKQVATVVNTPAVGGVTAGSGDEVARIVRVGETDKVTPTRSASAPDDTKLWGSRTTWEKWTYDPRGQVLTDDDLADGSLPQECATTTYQAAPAGNPGLVDLASSVMKVTGACGSKPTSAAAVVSAVQTKYDSAGDVVNVKKAYDWDAKLGILYRDSATTQYDGYGRPTLTWDAMGRARRIAYSPTSGIATAVSVEQGTAKSDGTFTSHSPKKMVSSQTLDPATGETLTSTNVAGNTATYRYDALGRVMAVWKTGRDAGKDKADYLFGYVVKQGLPVKVTTQKLNSTGGYTPSLVFYDGLLRERESQSPAAGNGAGRVIKETRYDGYGRVDLVTSPYYNSASVNLSDAKLVSESSAQSGSLARVPSYTVYFYDAAGRQVRSELRAGASAATVSADSVVYGGSWTMRVPPSGGVRTASLTDARGRTSAVWQYTKFSASSASGTAAEVTSYGYTPAGLLSSVAKDGVVWKRSYDVAGNLTGVDDPDAGVSSYFYDADGEQTLSKDGRGVWLLTRYDDLGRKTGVYDSDSKGTQGRRLSGWVWDTTQAGQLGSSVSYDSSGAASVTESVTGYDASGRVTGTDVKVAGAGQASGDYTSSTDYNADGSVQKATETAPGLSDVVTYSYDSLDHVLRLNDNQDSVVQSTVYSPQGDVLKRSFLSPSGQQFAETREYDQVTGRLTRQTASVAAAADVADVNYSYDASGRVTKVVDVSAASSALTRRECFSYDVLGRLSRAFTSTSSGCSVSAAGTGSVGAYDASYSFDGVGNRSLSVVTTGAGKVSTTSAAYPATSRVSTSGSGGPHAVASVTRNGVKSAYAYDGSGNVTDTGSKSLSYDDLGRLSRVVNRSSGAASAYVYDADGQRVVSRTSGGSSAGSAVVTVGDVQVTVSGSGSSAKTSSMRSFQIDGEPVGYVVDGRVVVEIADRHGTPYVGFDTVTGQTSKRLTDPFGNVLSTRSLADGKSVSWGTDRGFLNAPVDESGLVQVGAREYDPQLGRFTSVDPVLNAGDPTSLDGYEYADSDPVDGSDPSGLNLEGPSGGGSSSSSSSSSSVSGSSGGSGTTHHRKHHWWQSGWVKKVAAAVVVTAVVVLAPEAIPFIVAGVGEAVADAGAVAVATEAGIDVAAAAGEAAEAGGVVSAEVTGATAEASAAAEDTAAAASDAGDGAAGKAAESTAKTTARGSSQAASSEEGTAAEGSSGGRSVSCGGESFTAGTPVVLAAGGVTAISRLHVGDKVMATDPKTGVTSARTVQKVWVNHDRDLMDLSISTPAGVRVVHATAGHLFFDDTTGGWVKARDLAPGDRLRTGDGTTATLASTTIVPGEGDMWDLTIQGLHDFYIQTTNNDGVGGGGNVGGGEGVGGTAAVDPAQTTILTHNCPIAGGESEGFDLQAHEDAGGHTIARHVGMSDQDLVARNISKASTFTDYSSAESATGENLEANSSDIDSWLQGGSNRLVVENDMDSSAGRIYVRSQNSFTSPSGVRSVLQRTPESYFVLTSYPTM